MASATVPFSIHQDQWQRVWLAATSAVQSRKKHQVDFDIKERVGDFLRDYGPRSERPLTLRVYGTMMKGFSVLNNERARVLYTDCERLTYMFARRPYLEDSSNSKLPPAKRQRTDALTLDLALGKVHDAELFNWTQVPLEDGGFLQLEDAAPPTLPDALAIPQPSLLEDSRLLEESFSALAMVPLDAAAEAVRMADAADAAAADELDAADAFQALEAALIPTIAEGAAPVPSEGAAPLLAVEGVAEVKALPGKKKQPDTPISEMLAAVGDPSNLATTADGKQLQLDPWLAAPEGAEAENQLQVAETQLQVAVAKRRAPRPAPPPGHVYGFDRSTEMAEREFDAWQLDYNGIGGNVRTPIEYAEALNKSMPAAPDRFGNLREIFDPATAAIAAPAMLALDGPGMQQSLRQSRLDELPGWGLGEVSRDEAPIAKLGEASRDDAPIAPLLGAGEGGLPQVQALLAFQTEKQDVSAAADGKQPPQLSGSRDAFPKSPFRPYKPEAPLLSTQGADMELNKVLGVQGQQDSEDQEALPEFNADDAEVKYDDQTAQVGSILQRYLERSARESRKVTFDDLMPPASTDKDVAARAFLAVLTLATAGDFSAEQLQPYGAITISMPAASEYASMKA